MWAAILGPLIVTTVKHEWVLEFLAFLALMTTVLALRNFQRLRQSVHSTWLVWSGVGGLSLWIMLQTQFTPSGPSILYEAKAAVALIVTLVAFALIPAVNRNGDRDRSIAWAITAAEFFIIGQLLLSFFFGIGERHGSSFAVLRAFGFLGDSISPIVGFFVLRHALDRCPFRCTLAAFALAITGGIMALGVTLVGLFFLLLLRWRSWRPIRNGIAAILLAQFILHLSFVLGLTEMKFVAEQRPSLPQFSERIKVQNIGKSLVRSSEWYLRAINKSMANRALSLVAGIDIARRHPVIGVGFLQSNGQIPLVAARDPFGVSEVFVGSKNAWRDVKAIHNTSLRMFAELGIVGLGLFWVMCVGMIMIFLKPILVYARRGLAENNRLEIAAAVWGLSFILANQTVAWAAPGHPQLIWLAVCLGIVAAKHFTGQAVCKVVVTVREATAHVDAASVPQQNEDGPNETART